MVLPNYILVAMFVIICGAAFYETMRKAKHFYALEKEKKER